MSETNRNSTIGPAQPVSWSPDYKSNLVGIHDRTPEILDGDRGALIAAVDLRDRVDDVLTWARSRIRHCREQEAKFGAGDIAIEASTERRSLQAVVRMLTGEEV